MLSQEKPPHSRCTEHKENYKESDIKKSLPPRSGRINTAGSIAWTVSPVSGKHLENRGQGKQNRDHYFTIQREAQQNSGFAHGSTESLKENLPGE